MSYNLNFITDDQLDAAVLHLLQKAADASKNTAKKFGKNVIDPFSVLFEMGGFHLSEVDWQKSETYRQAQKSLQNHVGYFHQTVLASMPGWIDLGKNGGQVDLLCTEKKIIAEIKNKHNTVRGADLSTLYDELKNLVMPKSSKYQHYTAYYVAIIPKKTNKTYDKAFIPSAKSEGAKRPENPLIRQIDGKSFYAKVTGDADALEKLFNVLPDVIENQSKILAVQEQKNYIFADRSFAKNFFTTAFG